MLWLAALSALFLTGLGTQTALAAPPVHVTEGHTGGVRLDELCIPYTKGTVEVPIWVKNHGGADGLQVSIDYDEVFLGYAWYRTTNTNWRVERVSPYGRHRITFVLKQNLKNNAAAAQGDEEIAVHAVFYLKDSEVAPANRPFREHTPLSLGTDSPNGSIDTFFFTVAAGQDAYRPIRTHVTHGGLTIYYREGVEVGGGGMTPTEQAFSLPLYLTYFSGDGDAGKQRTYTVAIDYDEVFLGLQGIMGLSPPLDALEPGESPIELIAQTVGSAIFELNLAVDAPASGCRTHVADIYFKYNGLLPPDRHLLVDPSILDDARTPADPPGEGDLEPGDDKTDGGAAAQTPGNQPGVVELLPAFFVRGNADSSAQHTSRGLNYQADPTDAILILESVFLGGRKLPCEDAADVNDNGRVDLSDAVAILNHLFRSGPPPAAPYPAPGIDSALEDELGCESAVPYFEASPSSL